MYESNPVNLETIVNATGSGGGVFVATIPSSQRPGESRARIFLNVTSLVGTAPTIDMTVVADVNGVDHEIVAFTQSAAGASKQNVLVEACPNKLKTVYTAGGTVTDFDATVDIIRF